MATISRLSVSLNTKSGPFKRGLKRAGDMVKRFTKRIFSLKSAIVGALGGVALGKLLNDSFALWTTQERSIAALDASMKSMGRTTKGLSVDLQNLASQIQREGILGDEAIIQGTSFLTTYRKITDRLLPRTIRVMADLSAKMGGDVKNAANLLGRASEGLVGSLSRAGISLSDAAKESKDFETILGEIEQQVSGMNKALGSTASGSITKFGNALNDLKEVLGGITAVAIEPFLATMTLGFLGAQKSMTEINVLGERFRRWMVDSAKSLGIFVDLWYVLEGAIDGVRLGMNKAAIGILKIQQSFMTDANGLSGLFGDEFFSTSSIESVKLAIGDLMKENQLLNHGMKESVALFKVMAGIDDLGRGFSTPGTRFENRIDQFAFQAEVDMMASRLGLTPGGTFRDTSAADTKNQTPRQVRDPQISDTNDILRDIRRDLSIRGGSLGVAG